MSKQAVEQSFEVLVIRKDNTPMWRCHCDDALDPFYLQDLTSIPTWISNCIRYKVWGELTYPSRNFNGATSRFDVITYACSKLDGCLVSFY